MDYNTLEKLIVSQLVKMFSAICGARDFITLFIKIGHLSSFNPTDQIRPNLRVFFILVCAFCIQTK